MKSILNIAGVLITLSALSALITGGSQMAIGVAAVKAKRKAANNSTDSDSAIDAAWENIRRSA